MKMSNLTQSRAQIGPTDHRIKGIILCDFKDKIQHSRDDLSLFFWRNHDFRHPLDAEMSLDEEETQDIQGLRCLNSLIAWNI